ncbi:hypothetical protein GCM10023321_46340 [Pseudonocardia eucalypti]|uniref:Uncharacterized protein n=1 Tax=Pseudonocardia eucalypti TaxID=648755 RepID=A0ABP9QGS5_9PSEU|nr:hypothetical protein [Pseudonocardia eucalypti]
MTGSVDGLATLERVRVFLAERVAPSVPGELAGEFRAAVKLLETTGAELNERHVRLSAELADLLRHADRIIRRFGLEPHGPVLLALFRRAEELDLLDLHGLDALWRDARALGSALLVELRGYRDLPDTPADARAEATELAADFCACLGEHARARLHWQAVFPAIRNPPLEDDR